jgi:hypothetical protein
MNERIKELAEQCYVYNAKTDDIWFDKKKFAELVVKECLDILDGEDDYGYESRGVRIAAYRIKKHFGVEK